MPNCGKRNGNEPCCHDSPFRPPLPLRRLLLALPASAFYDYEHLPQLFTTGRLVDVAWHPDGDYALIIEGEGKVLRVEASGWSVNQVDDLARRGGTGEHQRDHRQRHEHAHIRHAVRMSIFTRGRPELPRRCERLE